MLLDPLVWLYVAGGQLFLAGLDNFPQQSLLEKWHSEEASRKHVAYELMFVLLNTFERETPDTLFEGLCYELLIFFNYCDLGFFDLLRRAAGEILMESNFHLGKVQLATLEQCNEYLEVAFFEQIPYVVAELKGVFPELDEVDLGLHHLLVIVVNEGYH